MIDSVQYRLVGLSIHHFGLDQDIFASISLFTVMLCGYSWSSEDISLKEIFQDPFSISSIILIIPRPFHSTNIVT